MSRDHPNGQTAGAREGVQIAGPGEQSEDVCVCLRAREQTHCNTVNRVHVEVDRIELYYHNDTPGVMPAGQRVAETAMFPLDNHSVTLQAVIWARPVTPGSPRDFEPYWDRPQTTIGDSDRYYCLGRQRPDIRSQGGSGYSGGNAPNLDDWRQQRLPQGTEVRHWPQNWPAPTFEWEELVHCAGSSDDEHNRTYTYERRPVTEIDQRTPETGWSVRRSFGAGMRRFRVAVRGCTTESEPTDSHELTSCSDDDLAAGRALMLPIRFSSVPQARDNSATLREMLRWATMFLGVPYEWGGHWFGGRTGTTAGGPGAYDGYGIDCSGLVSAAAWLAGIRWSPWRRGSASFPGTNLTGNNRSTVESGDIVWERDDPATAPHEGHVRIVWERLSEGASTDPRITCIESSGSARGVARFPRTGRKRFDPSGAALSSQHLQDFVVRRLDI
jgi:hypothetical protein